MRQRGVSGHRRFFVLGRTARDQKQSFEINVPSQAPTPMKPNLPSDPELDALALQVDGQLNDLQSPPASQV